MDESAQWLTWSSLTESDEVGAEIQKFLLPGDSLKYNAKLSDLIPAELLTVGNYRLFLPLLIDLQNLMTPLGRLKYLMVIPFLKSKYSSLLRYI